MPPWRRASRPTPARRWGGPGPPPLTRRPRGPGGGGGGGRRAARPGSAGGETRFPVADFPAFVRQREPELVRWVWDDTTRWYPALLEAGVRVERCADLRLRHAVLRRSPYVDQALLTADETLGWDALQPVTATVPALFPLDDPADRLDPVAEHARQQAALA